jgi:peptidoglycan/xylan/chitin deacetylase (PgdA/CDA1 family)
MADAMSALLIEPGRLPSALPQTLGRVESPLLSNDSPSGNAEPLTLFLTVDVEDSYFDHPILMTGEGVGPEFGVFGILDEFDARDLKGTFFVNVYEKDRQPKGAMEKIVREIAARGHEVGLHTHPSPTMDFYCKPLFWLPKADQAEVLRWGADLIADWAGEYPTSFRAGAYALNDETFSALEDVGIPVDSSCFFPSANNHNQRHTVNAVNMLGRTIEVPVTTVLRVNRAGELMHRKLDLDWLSVDELNAALATLGRYGASAAMFMMHSFSFIDKETRRFGQPPSSRARFISEVQQDRYVEVYGPKPETRNALSAFLEHILTESSVRVRTLRDALPGLTVGTLNLEDVVPIIA